MKKATIMGLSLGALVLVGSAYAAQGGIKLDADGNGVITRAEAQAGAATLFARLDANKDGKLDQSDRALLREKMKARMFERLDQDNNGEITKSEFMIGKGHGHGERGHGQDKPGHADTMGFGAGDLMRMVKQADTNGDGAISQAEFTTAVMARFDAMDTNRDGQVTQAERQAYRAQMKARMHDGGRAD